MQKEIPGFCTLCRSRCGTINVVENGRLVAVRPAANHPTGGALCAKGRAAPEFLYSPRRLTHPMRRTRPKGDPDPGWVEISWEEALSETAARMAAVRAEYGAEAVGFAATTGSGMPIMDSAEWIDRFIKSFGSPNMVYAIELCGWHKDYAQALTFGRGIGVPDLEHADVIMLWGFNPARTWLKQATRVADARRRGAKVVVIDPKQAGSGQEADLWLGIKPGTDGALMMGAIRHLISIRGYDDEFVRQWTNAPALMEVGSDRLLTAREIWPDAPEHALVVFDAAQAAPRLYDTERRLEDAEGVALRGSYSIETHDGRTITCVPVLEALWQRAARWTVDEVARETWLEPDDIAKFYQLLEGSRRVAYHGWTGLGQHANATQTERCLGSLYALTGACDREGGNLYLNQLPANKILGHELLPKEQYAKALGVDELPLGPPRHGWITLRDFSRAVLEGEPYKIRMFVNFGMNFVTSQGEGGRSLEVLKALDFHVHSDMYMSPTASMADIVLPVSMPWEREALRIGFEIDAEAVEHVQLRPAVVAPMGVGKSDTEIVFDLACRLGLEEQFFGGSVEAGYNHQLAPLGLTVDDLRKEPDGVRIPVAQAERKYAAEASDGKVAGFATSSRRVELFSTELASRGYDPLPKFVPLQAAVMSEDLPLMMTTAKNGYFVHSTGRHVASLRRKAPDPRVEISPALAKKRGLVDGDWAEVATAQGSVRLRVRIDPSLNERLVVAEFGWWEDCPPLGRSGFPLTGEVSANTNSVLSDKYRDPVSGSYNLRAVACDVRRASAIAPWLPGRAFRLAWRETVADDCLALAFVPVDGGETQAFLPGQFVQVRLPRLDAARSYSLIGSGASAHEIAVAVKLVRDEDGRPGKVSRYLHEELEVGDVVEIDPPTGLFTPPVTLSLPASLARPVILIAGGIGITPFLSVLRACDASSEKKGPPIFLLQAYRSRDHHPFAEEIEAIAARNPRIKVYSWYRCGLVGRGMLSVNMHSDMISDDVIAARPLVYLCGPDRLVDAMTAELTGRGVPSFDIFRERFASPTEVPAELADRKIRLARSGLEFIWSRADGSLLDAAQKAGAPLAGGCRVGQCETCSASIIDGAVGHLGESPDEPGSCLLCQAVPVSDLVIDA